MQSNEGSWVDLLNEIAHDLKTPLSAVKGFVDLIKQAGTLNDRQHHFVDRALMATNQMQTMVEMLLDVAWLDAEKPIDLSAVNASVLIAQATNLLERAALEKQIEIEVSVADNVDSFAGDERRLRQVVNNLLSNAIKYNRAGGKIWVDVKIDGDEIAMSFRDTGIGIPADQIAFVFDRFFRSPNIKPPIEGTGLGLSIVRGIIERHGGRVWVESVQDEGSTFFVVLPYKPYVPPIANDAPALADPHVGGEVEDAVNDDDQESPSPDIDAGDGEPSP